MTASIWNPGDFTDISQTNADNTYKSQRLANGVAGQTIFTLTQFAYAVGTGSLAVYVNGVRQHPGVDFEEVTPTSFKIVGGIELGDIVDAAALIGSPAAQSAAVSADNASASAIAAAGAEVNALAYSELARAFKDQVIVYRDATYNYYLGADAARILSQAWATQLTTEVVAGQGYSARQHAINAAASAAIAEAAAGTAQIQSDWAVTDTSRKDYIKNKSSVLQMLLTGVSAGVASAIQVTDSIISGFGKLQGQINTLIDTKITRSADNTSIGTRLNSGLCPSIASINGVAADQCSLIIGNGNNNFASAVVQFLRSGSHAVYFGLDTDNKIKIGGYSMGAVAHEVLHAGNTSYLMPKTGGFFSGGIGAPLGNAGAPSYAVGDGDTGIYGISDGVFGVTCNSQSIWTFTTTSSNTFRMIYADTSSQGANTTAQFINTNGLQIGLQGSGPNASKTLRILNGALDIVNSAYSAAIFVLQDSGNLTITGNFDAQTVLQRSDETKKKNWNRVADGFVRKLAAIEKIGTFEWTDHEEQVSCGIGAQSLEAILPSAIYTGDDGIKRVNTGGAAMVMCGELAKMLVELADEFETFKQTRN